MGKSKKKILLRLKICEEENIVFAPDAVILWPLICAFAPELLNAYLYRGTSAGARINASQNAQTHPEPSPTHSTYCSIISAECAR